MPFTLAHPAFALPLRWLGLPFAALAAGAMVPDVPLFAAALVPGMPVSRIYGHTHSVLGILTTDLVVGCGMWLLWHFVIRPALDAGLPSWLHERAGALVAGGSRWSALTVPVAVIAGAGSHVGVDEFTHAGRWAARNIPWFADQHLGHLGTAWAQYVGGVLGLAILAFLLGRHLKAAVPEHRARRNARLASWVWKAPLLCVLSATMVALTKLVAGGEARSVAFWLATAGGSAAALSMLVVAMVWRLTQLCEKAPTK